MAKPKNPSSGVKAIQGIEIHDDQEIDVVNPKELQDDFTTEAFMNEMVTVLIAPSADENQPPSVPLNCNGTNQPVFRGIPTMIKRKYVEILARMRETKYTQHTPNPSAPDQTIMIPRHGDCYPFEILEDKNPIGREWLRKIRAEPA